MGKTTTTSSIRKNHDLIEGKFSIDRLCDNASTIVAKKTAKSKILDTTAEDLIPKFDELGEYDMRPVRSD